MKKLILILTSSIFLTGCSLIPKVNFDTPNTVPQSVDRSKAKDTCKKGAKFTEDGTMVSCDKGYYSYAENYEKQERKMTFTERIKSYINSLVGWGFWAIILLVILCPSLLGLIAGRLLEGATGIAKKVNSRLLIAIQKTRKQGKDLNISLDAELDEEYKKYIKQIKDKENIK